MNHKGLQLGWTDSQGVCSQSTSQLSSWFLVRHCPSPFYRLVRPCKTMLHHDKRKCSHCGVQPWLWFGGETCITSLLTTPASSFNFPFVYYSAPWSKAATRLHWSGRHWSRCQCHTRPIQTLNVLPSSPQAVIRLANVRTICRLTISFYYTLTLIFRISTDTQHGKPMNVENNPFYYAFHTRSCSTAVLCALAGLIFNQRYCKILRIPSLVSPLQADTQMARVSLWFVLHTNCKRFIPYIWSWVCFHTHFWHVAHYWFGTDQVIIFVLIRFILWLHKDSDPLNISIRYSIPF